MKRLLILFLLFGLSYSFAAQPKKRLTARSYYNFDSTHLGRFREIPSDSNFYTYSSNRSGDWETGIQYTNNQYFTLDIHARPYTPTPSTKSLRFYDAQNNVLADTIYLWNVSDEKWEPSSLTIYTYNTKNQVLTELSQLWGGNRYVGYTQITNEYTAFDSLATSTYENYSDNEWKPNVRYTYSYDIKRRRTHNDVEEGYSTGEWQPLYSEIWMYDGKDHVIYEESTSGSSQRIVRRYYDAQDYLIAQSYEETSTIKRHDSTAYIYNKNHDSLTIIMRTELAGYPAATYKFAEQTFDKNRNLISNISYQYDNGTDIPLSLQRYTYDNAGRKTMDSLYVYALGKFELQGVNAYGYDADGKLKQEEYFSGTSAQTMLRYSLTETERTPSGQLSVVRYSQRVDSIGTWNIVGELHYYYNDVTGVEDNENASMLMVYPNPVHQNIYIETLDNEDITDVQVFDLHGKVMSGVQSDILGTTVRLRASELPNGAYVVLLTTMKGKRSIRFVKE